MKVGFFGLKQGTWENGGTINYWKKKLSTLNFILSKKIRNEGEIKNFSDHKGWKNYLLTNLQEMLKEVIHVEISDTK